VPLHNPRNLKELQICGVEDGFGQLKIVTETILPYEGGEPKRQPNRDSHKQKKSHYTKNAGCNVLAGGKNDEREKR
jgi:hypothetical protein